jgi:NTP pyrophosphatase (non-canonical NTP hydrolase)
MELTEIDQFIEEEIQRLEKYYRDKNKNELTMAMGFKLIEELGELFKEALGHKGYQTKAKLEKLNKDEIKKEFADVIITTLILAKRFNVDIEQAIKIKMDEIKKRDYNK